jgi:choline/glycine/proline betaine transport protein
MGIGPVFYGMTEPLMHLATPRPALDTEAASTAVRAKQALSTTYLHWGLP